MMKKLYVTIFITIIGMFFCSAANAQINADILNIESNQGCLIVNGNKFDNSMAIVDTKHFYTMEDWYMARQIFVPMRTVLENIDIKVDYDAITGDIILTSKDKTYICETRDDSYIRYKSMCIKDSAVNVVERADYFMSDVYYEIINDSIYLYQESATELFRKLGCDIKWDFENQAVTIKEGSANYPVGPNNVDSIIFTRW